MLVQEEETWHAGGEGSAVHSPIRIVTTAGCFSRGAEACRWEQQHPALSFPPSCPPPHQAPRSSRSYLGWMSLGERRG